MKAKNSLLFLLIIIFVGIICSTTYFSSTSNSDKYKYVTNNRTLNDGKLFDESNWDNQIPPEIGTDEWYNANKSNDSYIVYKKNNKFYVTKGKNLYSFEYKIDEGYFQVTNNGEFGGYLKFKPTNSIGYKVLYGNVNNIFNYDGSNYVLEGLAHLGINEGQILLLEKKFSFWPIGNKWSTVKIFDLHDAPETYTITDNNDLFIVTNNNLLEIRCKRQ